MFEESVAIKVQLSRSKFKVKYAHFMQLIEPTKICLRVKLQQNLTSSFTLQAIFIKNTKIAPNVIAQGQFILDVWRISR